MKINVMKKTPFILELLVIIILVSLSGCAVVGGIFKAGVGVGIFAVVVVVALILWLVSKAGKK